MQTVNKKNKKVVIVGAGVSGLTVAYKLCEAGFDVTVIEKEKEVGGLARSFRYDGFTFDIGPHRFHTDDKKVENFIKDILDDNYILIPRRSGVFMFKKYFNWPLEKEVLFKVPPLVGFKIFLDLIFRTYRTEKSFEDFVLNKYGKTIYKIFFGPYTKKFSFLDSSEIHRDWGEVGVNRAVIDKRVKVGTTFELIKNVFLPAPVKTEFIYPQDGGIAQFSLDLKNKIIKLGGKILTSTEITKIEMKKKLITSISINGRGPLKADFVVWTAPLGLLLKLLNEDDTIDLEYLSILCFNVMIKTQKSAGYQWCYYGGGDTVFCRVSNLNLFNQNNSPPGKTGLCVEITSVEKDDNWKNSKGLIPQLKKDLKKVDLIKNEKDVLDIKIEKIQNVYPRYKINYTDELKKANFLLKKYPNLITLGRTGNFWYNNMDHSIKQALEFSEHFIKNPLKSKLKIYDRSL